MLALRDDGPPSCVVFSQKDWSMGKNNQFRFSLNLIRSFFALLYLQNNLRQAPQTAPSANTSMYLHWLLFARSARSGDTHSRAGRTYGTTRYIATWDLRQVPYRGNKSSRWWFRRPQPPLPLRLPRHTCHTCRPRHPRHPRHSRRPRRPRRPVLVALVGK
jgi:hypothetical protein